MEGRLTQAARQGVNGLSESTGASTALTDRIAVVTSSHGKFLREKYNNDYYSNILKPRNVQ
jgi:hypothetical protein